MIYKNDTKEALFTVAPGGILPTGETLNTNWIHNHAQLIGKRVDGNQIDRVTYVFFMYDEAQKNLENLIGTGIGCKAINSNGEEVVLLNPDEEIADFSVTTDENDEILVPVLRHRAWLDDKEAPYKELLASEEKFGSLGGDMKGPIITYGIDTPKRIMAMLEDPHNRSIEEIHEGALENLRTLEVKMKEFSPGVMTLEGDYGVEQLLLLPEIQKKVCKELNNAESLIVCAPTEGPVLVCSFTDLNNTKAMVMFAEQQFNNFQHRKISKYPLILENGEVQGFVSPNDGEAVPKPEKKKWWKFW